MWRIVDLFVRLLDDGKQRMGRATDLEYSSHLLLAVIRNTKGTKTTKLNKITI